MPRALTRRAREILTDFERGPDAAGKSRRRVMATPAPEPVAMQLTLFSPPHPVVTAIEALEVEAMSPLEALTKLYELKRMTANDE